MIPRVLLKKFTQVSWKFLVLVLFFYVSACGANRPVEVQLEAPDPLVQGVSQALAIICGSAEDPPVDTLLVVITAQGTVKRELDENGDYSIYVCWDTGALGQFQYQDAGGEALSFLVEMDRPNSELGPDTCPEPTNEVPVCP